MPREFQELSDDMSEGFDQVTGSLEGVKEAAGKADEASFKLARTQAEAKNAADKHSASLDSLSGRMQDVGRANFSGLTGELKGTSSALSGVEAEARGVVSSLSEIGTAAGGVSKANSDLMGLEDTVRGLAATVLKNQDLSIGIKTNLKGDIENTISAIDNVKQQLAGMEANVALKIDISEIDNVVDQVRNALSQIEGELAGAASLDVGLINISDVQDIVKKTKEALEGVGKDITPGLSVVGVDESLESVQRVSEALGSLPADVMVRLSVEGLENATTGLEGLNINVAPQVDMASTRTAIEVLEETKGLLTFMGVDVSIGMEVDAGTAKAQLTELKTTLETIDNLNPDIEIEGLAEAQAEVNNLLEQMELKIDAIKFSFSQEGVPEAIGMLDTAKAKIDELDGKEFGILVTQEGADKAVDSIERVMKASEDLAAGKSSLLLSAEGREEVLADLQKIEDFKELLGENVDIGFDSSTVDTVRAKIEALNNLEVTPPVNFDEIETAETRITEIIKVAGSSDIKLDVSAPLTPMQELTEAIRDVRKEAEIPPKLEFEKALDSVKGTLDNLINKAEDTGKKLSDLDRQEYEINVSAAGANEAIVSLVKSDAHLREEFEKAFKETGSLDGALAHMAATFPQVTAAMDKGAKSGLEMARSSSTLSREISKVSSVSDLAKKKFQEGTSEANNFADGLGANGGAALGAGVAMVFLAGKVSSLIDSYQGAAVGLAQFRTEFAATERAFAGGEISGQLGAITDRLRLTREQAQKFGETAVKGLNAGVISAQGLESALGKLNETFGGIQTEKLEEFVNLLEEIPTLEADLSVTATTDDRAATIFALAKAGKIETVLDLQAAGVVGEGGPEAVAPEQQALIDAAQSSAKTLEMLTDSALAWFPTVGPMFGVLAGVVTTGFGVVGASLASLGAIKLIQGQQVKAQVDTQAAVQRAVDEQVETTKEVEDVERAVRKQAKQGRGGGPNVDADDVEDLGKSTSKATSAMNKLGAFAAIAGTAAFAIDKLADAAGVAEDSWVRSASDVLGGAAGIAGTLFAAGQAAMLFASVFPVAAAAITTAAAPVVAFAAAIALPVLGLGALALATWGVVKAMEHADDLTSKVADNLGGPLDRSMIRLATTGDMLAKSQAKLDAANLKSGLGLQRALGGIGKVVNNAKLEFFDFQKELAEAELGQLKNIGGSVEAFNSAIERASDSVEDKFSSISKGLAKERANILANGKLNAADRRTALDFLKQEEIKAAEALVEGVEAVIEGLFDAPDIINEQLKARIAELDFDFAADSGTLTEKGLKSAFAGLDNSFKAQTRILEQGQKAREKLGDIQLNLKSAAEEARIAFREVMPSISADLGDTLKDVFKKVTTKEGKETVEVNAEALESAAQGLDTDIAKGQKALDEVIAKTRGIKFLDLADDIRNLKQSQSSIPAEIDKARKELAKTEKGTQEYVNASKKVNDLVHKQGIDASDLAAAEDVLESKLLKAKVSQENITGVMDALVDGVHRNGNAGKAVEGELAKLVGDNREQAALVEKRGGILQKLGKDTRARAALEGLNANSNAENAELKNLVNIKEQEIDIAEENLNKIRNLGDAELDIVDEAQRRLAGLEEAEEMATLSGDAIAAFADTAKGQTELFSAVVASVNTSLGELAARKKATEDRLKKITTEAGKTAEAANLVAIERAIIEQKQKLGDASADLTDLLSSFISDSVDASLNGLTGRRVTAELDLGEALLDSAEFADDLAATTNEAYATISRAADKQLSLAVRAADLAFTEIQNTIEETIKAKKLTGSDADRFRQEALATAEAQKRGAISKAETDQKNTQFDTAQKIADLASQDLDIRKEAIEEEASFLSEIGGSLSAFVDLQNQTVQIERERLSVLQNQLSQAQAIDANSQKTRNLELQVVKQQFAVRKQELGVQKDIFEKIIGSAFGEVRASVGARRRRLSDVAVLGVQQTRIKTAAGVLGPGGKAGGPKTINERSIARQLSGVGGRGIGQGKSEEPPERLQIEKDMEAGIRKTEGNTADTADASRISAHVLKDSHGNSLITHDDIAEAAINNLIDVDKQQLGVLQSIDAGIASTSDVTKDVKSETEKGTEKSKDVEKVSKTQTEKQKEGVKADKEAVEETKKVKETNEVQVIKQKESVEVDKEATKEAKEVTPKRAADVKPEKATDKTEQTAQAKKDKDVEVERQKLTNLNDQLKAVKESKVKGSKRTKEISRLEAEIANQQTVVKEKEGIANQQAEVDKQLAKEREIRNPLAGTSVVNAARGGAPGGIPSVPVTAAPGGTPAAGPAAGVVAEVKKEEEKTRDTEEQTATKAETTDDKAIQEQKKARDVQEKISAEEKAARDREFVAAGGVLRDETDLEAGIGEAAFGGKKVAGEDLDEMAANVPSATRDAIEFFGDDFKVGDAKFGEGDEARDKFDAGAAGAASREDTRKKLAAQPGSKASHNLTEEEIVQRLAEGTKGGNQEQPAPKEEALKFTEAIDASPDQQLGLDAQQDTAESIGSLADRGEKIGSIFVHDTHVNETMMSLLDVNNKQLEVMQSSLGVEAGAGPEITEGPGGALTGAEPAGSGEEMPAMMVKGEIMVRFDNKMFRDQIATVIGEVINTGEIRKALEKAGFLNTNA